MIAARLIEGRTLDVLCWVFIEWVLLLFVLCCLLCRSQKLWLSCLV